MKRVATATWKGGPRAGEGTISTVSGVFDKAIYTGGTSSMDVPCTNPSEILAAAEAACVSMMVAKELGKEGITPDHIETEAEIVLAPDGDSWNIPRIHLTVKAHVAEIDSAKFQEAVQRAKKNCPITRSLKSEVSLEALIEPIVLA
ncbi:MAG TPA: OsmC family peroxiredoxin [Terriglobales bacterium]|nr:OsmC family peroxiredoxin [Terriglobales bacterium]